MHYRIYSIGKQMKTYVVTIVRSSYVDITVDANSRDEAEALAWAEQDRMQYEWKPSDEWETLRVDEIKTLGELEAESTDGFRNPERN
jgi:hypothetical protein